MAATTDETVATERARFRREILAAGLLVATNVDGRYQRSGTSEAIVRSVEALASRAAGGNSGRQYFFSPIMPRDVLERITLALIKRHGVDPAQWSPAVRSKLWP